MKSLTHEEFIKKIAEANPNVKIASQYINRKTRISISCRMCGKIIETFPQNLYTHSGLCKTCSITEAKHKTTKTHEEFIKELAEENPNIIVTGKYVNATTKIEWVCRKCRKKQYSRPSALKESSGLCKSCSGRISHEEYVRRVFEKNPNIRIVGKFIDSNTPIEWSCNRCGKISSASPRILSRLSGICKQCQFDEKKESFFEQYKELQTPPILLSQYEGVTKKILCRCKICGYEWRSLPSVIITYKYPCPKCADLAVRTKHADFVDDMKDINPNIEIIGEYFLTNKPILCRCKLCNNEWSARPMDLKKGKGCPECNHASTSFVEQLFLVALRQQFGNEEVLSRDRNAINKELDIYVPSKKLAIEYGFWYWHKDRIINDQEKMNKCEENGILLICIYDSCKELENIDTSKFRNTYFYKEALSENVILVRVLLSTVLSQINENFSLSDESWSEIKNQAYIQSRRKTTQEFIDQLSEINENIQVLGEYKGSAISISVKCVQCGRIWDARPKELSKGVGCADCYHRQQKDTHEEFVAKLKEINDNIEVLGKYNRRKDRIHVKCKICGHEWNPLANGLLIGKGCPKCGGYHYPRTKDDVLSSIAEKNPSIEIIGQYVNTSTPLLVRCKKCGREWNPTPTQLLKGLSCLDCFRKSKRKTHEQFVEEMSKIHPNIEVIGQYQKALLPVKLRCLSCGYIWETKPSVSLSGRGCPQCAKNRNKRIVK